MGNQRSKTIYKDFMSRQYQEVISHQDSNIRTYRIIKFNREERTLYICTTVNPEEYDSYNTDNDHFISRLLRSHPNLCEFCFMGPNGADASKYDLVFEFGDYINKTFQDENVIWTFINHMIEGLIFLQDEGFHYPFIRKKYTVYQSESRSFKLFNPYCFPSFVNHVLGTYLNREVKNSDRSRFQTQNIMRNIKEFGITILALIKNEDETFFFKSPSAIHRSFATLKTDHNYSDQLVNFLIYTIENRAQMSFADLRRFIALDKVGSHAQQFRALYNQNSSQFYYDLNAIFGGQLAGLAPANPRPPEIPAAASGRNVAAPPVKEFKLSYDSQTKPAPPPAPPKPSAKPAPINPNKKLKRIVCKWSEEEKNHKEYYEYEDGSLEDRFPPQPAQPVEAAKPAPVQIPPPQIKGVAEVNFGDGARPKILDQKKSHMAHYEIKQVSKSVPKHSTEKSTWNIILYSENVSEPAKLILTANIRDVYNTYDYMKDVVDRRVGLRPSAYHSLADAAPATKEQPGEDQTGREIGYQIRSLETHPFTVNNLRQTQ